MKEEINHAIKIAIGLLLIIGAIILFSQACGSVNAGNVRAVEIPGPVGVNCYAVMDDSHVVGGNCVRAW